MIHKLILIILVLSLPSCATVQTPVTKTSLSTPASVIKIDGIKHIVEKGQTLWRIARIYNMDLDEIVRINQIPESSSISVGQIIIIPKTATNQTKTNFSYSDYSDFIWPVQGKIITQFKQKIGGVQSKGIDIAASKDQEILASRDGRVAFVGNIPGYGQTLIIDHKDGLSTVYCGSSETSVQPGEDILQGKPIAKIGRSPRSDIEILHFEIRKKHKPQNPLFYLN